MFVTLTFLRNGSTAVVRDTQNSGKSRSEIRNIKWILDLFAVILLFSSIIINHHQIIMLIIFSMFPIIQQANLSDIC